MKYREFWIQDLAETTYRATEVSCYDEEVNPSIIDEWHVIDYAAYAEAVKMIEEMAGALEYYDGVHRLNWAINFDDLPKKAKDQLDKYKRWRAGE